MTIGVGLFGTITAFLANAFVGPGDDEPAESTDPSTKLNDLAAQLEEIKHMLEIYGMTSTDMKAKQEGLEASSDEPGK